MVHLIFPCIILNFLWFQDASTSLTEEDQTSASTAEAAIPDKTPTTETKDEEGVRLICVGLMYYDLLIIFLL
jgi:hypothetical protein